MPILNKCLVSHSETVTQPPDTLTLQRTPPPRLGYLSPHTEEALRNLQEECAEVVQAASKVCRAGPDYIPFADTLDSDKRTMRDRLVQELGDVQALVNELLKSGFIKQTDIDIAAKIKSNKLFKWTNFLGSKE